MKTIQVFLLILFAFISLQAAHIHGGYITAEIVDVNTAEGKSTLNVACELYRDALSGGAPYDRDVQFGIYVQNNNGDYQLYDEVVVDEITNFGIAFDYLNQVTIERGTYRFTVDLDHGLDYLIAFQRCCRSPVISNLVDLDESGIAIQLDLSAEALLEPYTLPHFGDIPLTLVKTGEFFQDSFDLRIDDGTSVELEFVQPRQSGGTFDTTGPGAGSLGCCECVKPEAMMCLPPFALVAFNSMSADAFGVSNPVILDNSYLGFEGMTREIGVFQYGIQITSSRNGVVLAQQIFDYTLYSLLIDNVDDNPMNSAMLYPNPNQGKIFLDQLEILPTKYEVFSQDGTLLYTEEVSGSSLILETEVGVYYLRLTDERSGEQVIARTVKM